MKVMVSTPPGRTTELWPPLGLLYIAASLKEKRADEIVVLDAFCRNMTADQLVDEVLRERPDVFGMNCSTHTFLEAVKVMEQVSIKLPETKLVMGGYHATFAAERILNDYPFIDFVLKGEAEHSFVQLLDCLDEDRSPDQVSGISYRAGEGHVDQPLSLIEDLDALPTIDRGLLKGVDYGYGINGIPLTFGKFTTMTTSRGCPFNCAYCSCASFSLRKWRARSAMSVAQELEDLYEQGYENVVLVDDNFTHDRKRAERICDELLDRKVKLRLYCEGRVNSASYELLRKMKKAGFDVIYFGAESASPATLKYYNKTIRPEQINEAVSNAKRARMIVVTSFILGAPIESTEDLEHTIDFIGNLRPHAIQINILDYLIGTPLWSDLERAGRIQKGDWKTNHRVYEYDGSHSKEELESLVKQGYDTYIGSWKNILGIQELTRLVLTNRTARRVVFSNLFNPEARSTVISGWKG